jgi:hypothetical protein
LRLAIWPNRFRVRASGPLRHDKQQACGLSGMTGSQSPVCANADQTVEFPAFSMITK